MSEIDPSQVSQLKAQFFALIQDITVFQKQVGEKMKKNPSAYMNDESNSVYPRYLRELQQVRDRKKAEVEKWVTGENEEAERFRKGQIYCAEKDYENKIQESENQIRDFLLYKLDHLDKQFPKQTSYFKEKGYTRPQRIAAPIQEMLNPPVETEQTKRPLCTSEESAQDLQQLHQIEGTKDQFEHKYPDFTVQASITIQIPGLPPVSGTVHSFDDFGFELQFANGKIQKFTYVTFIVGGGEISF